MSRRWLGTAPVALVLVGVLTLSGQVGAQDEAVPNDNLGLVAEIHAGQCADLETDVAFSLGTLTRSEADTNDTDNDTAGGGISLGDGLIGVTDVAPVWITRQTVDAAPDDLFDQDQPYAIVVGESGPTGAVAACGDLGGVSAYGAVAVALLPGAATDAGTLAGVAVFDAPGTEAAPADDATATLATDTDDQTRVTVYVVQLAEAALATPTEVLTEVASPVLTEVTQATPPATEELEATEESDATEAPVGSPAA